MIGAVACGIHAWIRTAAVVVNDNAIVADNARSFCQFGVGNDANANNDDIGWEALFTADDLCNFAISCKPRHTCAGVNVNPAPFVQLVIVGRHFWRGYALQNAFFHFKHVDIEA